MPQIDYSVTCKRCGQVIKAKYDRELCSDIFYEAIRDAGMAFVKRPYFVHPVFMGLYVSPKKIAKELRDNCPSVNTYSLPGWTLKHYDENHDVGLCVCHRCYEEITSRLIAIIWKAANDLNAMWDKIEEEVKK